MNDSKHTRCPHPLSSMSSPATNSSPHLHGYLKQRPAASYAIASMSTVSLAVAGQSLLHCPRCHSCSFAGSLRISKALFSLANAAASPPLFGCFYSRMLSGQAEGDGMPPRVCEDECCPFVIGAGVS
jgi:hypothetical protein